MVLDLILGVVKAVRPPAMKPEPIYEVKVESNDVLIKKQKENS